VGDEVEVKVIEIDNDGRIRLSRKAVLSPGSEVNTAPHRGRREGTPARPPQGAHGRAR